MKKSNKKYDQVITLFDRIQKRGWNIQETLFDYSDKVHIGTILMEWLLNRNSNDKTIKIEFVASQIDISTLADKNDFEELIIKETKEQFYFEKNQESWDCQINNIILALEKYKPSICERLRFARHK